MDAKYELKEEKETKITQTDIGTEEKHSLLSKKYKTQ